MQRCNFKLSVCFLIVTLSSAFVCGAWLESVKGCPQGCEERGNCNQELGVCECPYGWSGPACDVPLFPGCLTSQKGRLVLYGPLLPKSCSCMLSLRKYFRDNPDAFNRYGCYSRTCDYWGSAKCYKRVGVPEEQQYTDYPADGEDVQWFAAPGPHPDDLTQLESRPAWDFQGLPYVPLNDCKDRCNERGWCLKAKEPSCWCFKGYTGAACEQVVEEACLGRCSGHGTCEGGFCHCNKGWWGQDCSRSKAYAPDPSQPREVAGRAYNRTHVRIYRYELPWNIAFPEASFDDGRFDFDRLYGSFQQFYEQFSSDWVVRTENPDEANLFYVPGLIYYYTANAGDPARWVARVFQYIRATYPRLWGRNNGKDHFLWITGDIGACWLMGTPLQQNPIKIVHFGLQVHKQNYTTMPLRDHVSKMQSYAREYSCFKQEKDIVAPPHIHKETAIFEQANKVYEEAIKPDHTRKYVLFFGGGIRYLQPEYSGGARQIWHTHFIQNNTEPYPDIKYGGSSSADGVLADFCLVPYGDGWGSRIMFAMQHACIPVVTQDFVHQPFDEVMPWHEFSLRLRNVDIPDMMNILRGVSQQRKWEYRVAMNKYRQAFSWHPALGGTAYNWTITSLHKKLYNLWGYHYKLR